MAIKDPESILASMIELVHERLADAMETAKAAKACAGVGNLDEAIRITFAIEQPIYEVTTLLNAATLIKRLSSEEG